MKRFSIKKSKIVLGESFKNFEKYLPKKQIIVLTDNKVNGLYGHFFSNYRLIEIGQGEGIKNMDTVLFVLNKLTDFKADRHTFLLVVGGGIVCDIGGFVASIFMRGIAFGFISTTLLSQVDASMGGKNGVNFLGFKNIIGVFNQPSFVMCDVAMLNTLSKKDLNCGFAEIVKHAIIDDEKMFAFLEENTQKALDLDPEVIEKLILQSIKIKAKIVNKDEKETGERRKLNLGHTYGHVLEKLLKIPHGNAVSMGLVMAAKLSVEKNMLSAFDYERIVRLLKALELPTAADCEHNKMLDTLLMDKKRENDFIHFVLINKIGQVSIKNLSIHELAMCN